VCEELSQDARESGSRPYDMISDRKGALLDYVVHYLGRRAQDDMCSETQDPILEFLKDHSYCEYWFRNFDEMTKLFHVRNMKLLGICVASIIGLNEIVDRQARLGVYVSEMALPYNFIPLH